MSTLAEPSARIGRRSPEFQAQLWAKWPLAEQWPAKLDLYEAAAYLRCNYITLWRACKCGRDGRARLAHQRIGRDYRIDRRTLDAFGSVKQRGAA